MDYYVTTGNVSTITKNGQTLYTLSYENSANPDQLTRINGYSLAYDNIGNPTRYYKDGYLIMTWQRGRKLVDINGQYARTTFTYDSDGNRLTKMHTDNTTAVTTTTNYYYCDGLLVGEKTGNNILTYIYDESSSIVGIIYNGTPYYFIKNLQGDVIAITNEFGTIVGRYTYDPWGNIESITGENNMPCFTGDIVMINPIRYRGYYYDIETGFYWLQTRFYDPAIGRFINADSQLNNSLGFLGLNQFSYCLNNPVNMVDYGGNKPGDLFDTMDEAARDAAIYMGKLSFENEWEYATAIYKVNVVKKHTKRTITTYTFLWWSWSEIQEEIYITKQLKYTYEAVITKKDKTHVPVPNVQPPRKRVAAVHTHPMGSWKGITQFSPGDLKIAADFNLIIYVHGPNGQLKRYNPSTGKDVLVFSDLPISPKTPWLD